MYNKILVTLDGSETAEQVLPYSRGLARRLGIPVDLITVIDVTETARNFPAGEGLFLKQLAEDEVRRAGPYLEEIAGSLPGAAAGCLVKPGRAADLIIETARADKGTLITMATHGRSGLNRFLLGSVAERVLRGTQNPLLLVRATERAKTDGEIAMKSVVVPLDGSALAEGVLPATEELATKLDLEVVLFRAYAIPYGAYTAGDGFYDPVHLDSFLAQLREETYDYLELKTADLKKKGLPRVSYVAREGLSADEIISFGRQTADNLIAMCTHGRSGVTRWLLGSVTETVVRHCGDPVLVLRAAT
jgi:nucleotide-binding universal stress UspA family protein